MLYSPFGRNRYAPTLFEFGGRPHPTDFTIDNTPALNRAIAALAGGTLSVLRIPAGVWTFKSQPNPVPCGIHVEGDGGSSSFYQGGTTLYKNFTSANSTDKFLHWDGSGQASNSSGGGMRRIGLMAAFGTTKGVAFGATAQSDTQRPGYTIFEDILVRAEGGGSFDYAFIGDGQNCVTSGGQGLRDLTFRNVYLSGAAVEVGQLINCTNVNYENLYSYQAGGAATVFRISGASNASLSKSTNASGKIYAQDLYLDNCQQQHLIVQCSGTLLKTANATDCKVFGSAVTESWTEDATSIRVTPATTSSFFGQVKFPATQNPSSDANTLDDYEEGSFTPGVSFGGGTTGVTYSAQIGSYTKIGRHVEASLRVTLSAKGSSTGAAKITGLPFAAGTGAAYYVGSVGFAFGMSSLTGVIRAAAVASASAINLYQTGASGDSLLNDTFFTNSTDIVISISYDV